MELARGSLLAYSMPQELLTELFVRRKGYVIRIDAKLSNNFFPHSLRLFRHVRCVATILLSSHLVC